MKFLVSLVYPPLTFFTSSFWRVKLGEPPQTRAYAAVCMRGSGARSNFVANFVVKCGLMCLVEDAGVYGKVRRILLFLLCCAFSEQAAKDKEPVAGCLG